MTNRLIRCAAAVGVFTVALVIQAVPASASSPPAHRPIYMADANHQGAASLQPPPVCCLPIPQDVTGPLPVPAMVNMAYFGGHVQVAPKIYLVLWGWGETGAFDHANPGMPASDPDGAGQRMLNFIKALGGTTWAGVQTQYYETVNGTNTTISNPANQFGGVWYDNTNPIHDNLADIELAQEAQRAVAHFGTTGLLNSQFIIATPQKDNAAGFNSGAGYCAWHDYTVPSVYPGVQQGISFTNMPYVLNLGESCGEHSVNAGYWAGLLDGFTIVLGHEIEETVTDPGAEETAADGTQLGAWFDFAGWENGDKCAWTGDTFGLTNPTVFPGGLNNIKGNDGKLYPVQSLWSNDAAGGAGYCAGNGNDLPF